MVICSLVLVADVQSLIHDILPPLGPILLIVDPAAIWAVLKVEIFTQKNVNSYFTVRLYNPIASGKIHEFLLVKCRYCYPCHSQSSKNVFSYL